MSLEEKINGVQMPLEAKVADAEEREQAVKTTLEKLRQEKEANISAMEAEISLIRHKVYTYDELIDYIHKLHEAGGDNAVARYLAIYGEVVKIDDKLDEISMIMGSLWNYEPDIMFANEDGRYEFYEVNVLKKKKARLQKKRTELISSIGVMSDCMFGYIEKRSRNIY